MEGRILTSIPRSLLWTRKVCEFIWISEEPRQIGKAVARYLCGSTVLSTCLSSDISVSVFARQIRAFKKAAESTWLLKRQCSVIQLEKRWLRRSTGTLHAGCRYRTILTVVDGVLSKQRVFSWSIHYVRRARVVFLFFLQPTLGVRCWLRSCGSVGAVERGGRDSGGLGGGAGAARGDWRRNRNDSGDWSTPTTTTTTSVTASATIAANCA